MRKKNKWKIMIIQINIKLPSLKIIRVHNIYYKGLGGVGLTSIEMYVLLNISDSV